MYMYVQIDGGMCICNIQMYTIVHVCVCECVHVNVQCIYMYYNRTYLYIIHIYIYMWINTPGKMCHKQTWRMEANGVVLRSWMVAPWVFPPKRWLSLWQDHSVVNEILAVSIIWRAIQPLESLEQLISTGFISSFTHRRRELVTTLEGRRPNVRYSSAKETPGSKMK